MREMETTTSIALSTANATPTPKASETDTHHTVRLASVDVQKIPILKLRNNV
jgi:ribosomal protein L7/L12